MKTMRLQRGLGWIQGSLVFLIVFLQCTQRPGILQSVGEVLGVLILGLFVIYALLGYRGELNTQKILFLVLTWLFGVYLWEQALISGEGVSRAALINVVFVLIASCTVILIRRDAWQNALKGVVYPAMFFGMSYLVSTILVFAFGMSLSEIAWFSFGLDQAGVENRYHITMYFPFSLSMHLGNVTFFGFEWARAIGYMREPGIYQVIAGTSYFGIDYLKGIKWRKFWKGVLLLSLFLTFSTAGLGAFLAAALYYYVLARRDTSSLATGSGASEARASRVGWGVSLVASAGIAGAGYWFVFTDQKYGLLRKLSFRSGSWRIQDMMKSIDALSAHPFLGVGYTNKIGEGFSFLGVTGEIGIIGILLFLLVCTIPLIHRIRRRDRILALLIPPFLTAMLAQPLFDKPVFYVILSLLVAYPYEPETSF